MDNRILFLQKCLLNSSPHFIRLLSELLNLMLLLYLGNSQVSVYRTIGPTLVIIIITSVSSKFTDFLLLTDVCQQHIFRIFAIDFHNLSFPQTTNRLT